ncbi:MAG TPA: Flp pilus assembly protein CpaB [Alphaproteobacteria bacterium]|jgi:pilus assembly protein CpaB|nr:Flp pilus assembly protein CpaB [Alphaproteobacteria bacterium]
MKIRTILFAAIALIMGLVTATFARHQLTAAREHVMQQAQERPSTTAYVLVAAHDVPAGELLQDDDFTWQSWPDDRLSDAYLRKGRDDAHSLAGAVVRQHIGQGEPIGTGSVIHPGERGFLAAVLAPGMRASTVPLNATADGAGLILPGDHVDLLLSHQIPDMETPNAPARNVSETVLSNVRVVAIDQTVNDQDKKPITGKTATFEVTSKQAESIEVAKLIGNLSIVLRSAGDPEGKDGAKQMAAGPTWDSDVSPLLKRPDRGSGGVASVTILRGNAKDGDGGPATATGGLGAGAVSMNNGANAAKGIVNAVSALRATAGAGLVGGF